MKSPTAFQTPATATLARKQELFAAMQKSQIALLVVGTARLLVGVEPGAGLDRVARWATVSRFDRVCGPVRSTVDLRRQAPFRRPRASSAGRSRRSCTGRRCVRRADDALGRLAISAASWKPERISFSLPGYQLISPMAKMPGSEVSNFSVSTAIRFSSRLSPQSAIGPSFIVSPKNGSRRVQGISTSPSGPLIVADRSCRRCLQAR